MSQSNIRVIFFGAIIAVIWGGYEILMTSYTAFTWGKTEGTIVDFERSVWSCGKGVSQCFRPIAGYHVRDNYYTVVAKKSFSNHEPNHLSGEKVVVYYSPLNPSEAYLGGQYGPLNHGIIIFLIGVVVLIIFWFVQKKNQSD